MFQKLKTLLISAALMFVLTAPVALAVVPNDGGSGGGSTSSSGGPANNDPCHPEKHNPPGTKLTDQQYLACVNCQNKTVAGVQGCLSNNPIVKDLNVIVNFLAGLVGVLVVAMLIMGGIQYSTARNKPEAITAAKTRITNALIALIAFMLIYVFVQWLIPGGVFK